MALEDLTTAGKLKTIIERIVEAKIDSMRPPYRMARVTAINRDEWYARVVLNGDPEDAVVTVSMGSIQPAVAGQFVRIEGNHADRFIADVVGGGVFIEYQEVEE